MAEVERIRVAIASPSDVNAERERIKEVFTRWNNANDHAFLLPKMWEYASPTLGGHPQKIINERIINESDLMIALFWSRLGTATPDADSGTVEEIEQFIEKKGAGRVMLYFCTRSFPHNIDLAQVQMVRDFKERMKKEGLFREFDTTEHFESELYSHLDFVTTQLVTGLLDQPTASTVKLPLSPGATVTGSEEPVIDFGATLPEITKRFKGQMDIFDCIDGIGDAKVKFYRNGSRIYTSVADSLDRFLHRETRLPGHIRSAVDRIAHRLKKLAGTIPAPGADFRQYWKDGREISNDLAAQLQHMHRTTTQSSSR